MDNNNHIFFALCEDGTLEIFESLHKIRKQCEGIDVESGVWQFYDAQGKPLKPHFHTPNVVKKHLFGLITSIASSQNFDLVPAVDEAPLLAVVTEETILNPNKAFKTMTELTAHLKKFAEQE